MPTPVWFITAAGSGFGHALALEALSHSHHVIATSRSLSKLSPLAAKGALTLALDVTAPLSTIEAAVKKAVDTYGPITHLVNAAGYCLVGAVEETSPEEDLATFNTNVLGTLNVTKVVLPYLRGGSGDRVVCNFGSIASWTGGAGAAL
jgi:NAD(P)-dependent dehydrogenase (short-subunit alcohol dehydrogenase family)